MGALVLLTGGAGLLASYTLLQAGVSPLGIRYPLALCIAYLVFLALLWLWLRTQADDYRDAPDLSGHAHSDACGNQADVQRPLSSGDGGDFSGGGATASFDGQDLAGAYLPEVPESPVSLADGLAATGDADEAALPLLVIVLVAGLAFSSLYIVYSAPALFAELLLDGALSATLYRRLKGLNRQHWVETAIRRTALPFLLTAAFLAASGWMLNVYAPQAKSIGDVIRDSKDKA